MAFLNVILTSCPSRKHKIRHKRKKKASHVDKLECCTHTAANREYHIVALVMCKVMVTMCVHVEDTALCVGDHVLSHFLKLRYIVCILTLDLCDQDMNRHFLHKHSGNKDYILYQVCEKQINQTNKQKKKQPVSQINLRNTYLA